MNKLILNVVGLLYDAAFVLAFIGMACGASLWFAVDESELEGAENLFAFIVFVLSPVAYAPLVLTWWVKANFTHQTSLGFDMTPIARLIFWFLGEKLAAPELIDQAISEQPLFSGESRHRRPGRRRRGFSDTLH